MSTISILFLVLLGLIFITGLFCVVCPRTKVGNPTRRCPESGETLPVAESCYLQGVNDDHNFSCSFVEFDGRGDFVEFAQHQDCLDRIKDLANFHSRVLLVIYCHGWKNNAHSSDVVRFNSFLKRLAATSANDDSKIRVHGVYLAWRGNEYKPFVDRNTQEFQEVKSALGGDPVSRKFTRKHKHPGSFFEQLTYWSRKRAAEHQVSGVSITRAVFSYAGIAKKNETGSGPENRVILMGHSFGSLMLEQSVLPGMVGDLMAEWRWHAITGPDETEVKRSPFEMILLVNSAAPSIYALQTRNFLSAHQKALEEANIPNAEAPIVVSVTSRADGATKKMHRLGNLHSKWRPSMQRHYFSRLLKTARRGDCHPPVHQGEFYLRTPGHNPMLVNRWIVPENTTSPLEMNAFRSNLNESVSDPTRFFLHPTLSNDGKEVTEAEAELWRITEDNPAEICKIKGIEVDPWTKSAYWIVECGKEIIRDHGDVWSDRAMDFYAALYRLCRMLRKSGRQD